MNGVNILQGIGLANVATTANRIRLLSSEKNAEVIIWTSSGLYHMDESGDKGSTEYIIYLRANYYLYWMTGSKRSAKETAFLSQE